nr:c-type cytochrome biogenensis protein [Cryptomonas sp. NIES-345]BDA98363.1 c-type cytochrome biogenensis protein [Cryptomonas sp. NIES-1327]
MKTITKIKQAIWKYILVLGNLKLSIALLLLIAISSSLGTIIEQEKMSSFYELTYSKVNPALGFLTSDIILILGLDHIYRSSWFFSLIIIFSGSLISCTITRQIPSLKLARLWQFLRRDTYKNNTGISTTIHTNLTKITYILRKKNYNVIQQGPYLYAYRGLLGKISPIIVHISIITIIAGCIGSVLTNFICQEIVPKGYTFHLQNTTSSGPLSKVNKNFKTYIKDFKISYTEQGSIDQFYSELAILDKNLDVEIEKTIFVNEPLKYNEISIYQTDWGIESVTLLNQLESKNIKLQNISPNNSTKLWITSLSQAKNPLTLIQDLTGNLLIYNKGGKVIGMSYIGSKLFLTGEEHRITKLTPTTGLQIKADLGISIIYLGFSLLLPSIVISYTSYSQIWGIKRDKNLQIYANTNRSSYQFEKFLLEIKFLLEREEKYKNLKKI